MENALVSIGTKYSGKVKVELRNVETGLIEESYEQKNMLQNSWIDWSFTNLTRYQGNGYGYIAGVNYKWPWDSSNDGLVMGGVKIGTSDTPVARTQGGIMGTTLADLNSNYGQTVDRSNLGSNCYLTRKWVFAAGVGTGLVKECTLYGGYDNNGNPRTISRVVLDQPLNKTAAHELTIQWTLSLSGGLVGEGDIPGGQRDGTTNIHWKAFINNQQLQVWGVGNSEFPVWAWPNIGYNIWTGNSNADSDLINDTPNMLKGTTIATNQTANLSTLANYTNGNAYRDFTLVLDTSQSNGQIGEMLLDLAGDSYSYHRAGARVTFNPPLDKVSTYQLALTFRIGLNLS